MAKYWQLSQRAIEDIDDIIDSVSEYTGSQLAAKNYPPNFLINSNLSPISRKPAKKSALMFAKHFADIIESFIKKLNNLSLY